MDEEAVVAFLAVGLIFGGPVICFIVARALGAIERLARVHVDSKLKTAMIERGYSVAEIERLCNMPVDAEALRHAMRADVYPAAVGPQKPMKA